MHTHSSSKWSTFELLSHLESMGFFKIMIKGTLIIYAWFQKPAWRKWQSRKFKQEKKSVFRILAFLRQDSAKPPALLLCQVRGSNYQAANMNRKATKKAMHLIIMCSIGLSTAVFICESRIYLLQTPQLHILCVYFSVSPRRSYEKYLKLFQMRTNERIEK